jgi:hypothetical protein
MAVVPEDGAGPLPNQGIANSLEGAKDVLVSRYEQVLAATSAGR